MGVIDMTELQFIFTFFIAFPIMIIGTELIISGIILFSLKNLGVFY